MSIFLAQDAGRRLPTLCSLAVLLLTAAGADSAQADNATRWLVERSSERRVALAYSAPTTAGRLLTVDNVCGSIRLRAHRDDTVSVHILETVRARTARDADRAQRETQLRTIEAPDAIRLIADGPFRLADGSLRWHDRRYVVCYDLTITAPQRLDVDLRTINRGTVDVEGIEGDLVVSNVNGPLVIGEVTGSGALSTVNGDIDLNVRALPTDAWSIETVNGDVEASFPPRLAAELRFTTMNGEILTDFAVRTRPGESLQRGRGEDGVFRAERRRAVHARVGNGGPEIAIETLNGDIVLRRTGAATP